MKTKILEERKFLKDDLRMQMRFEMTDQNSGVPMPPVEPEIQPGDDCISLTPVSELQAIDTSLNGAITHRRSIRKYKDQKMTLKELTYCLWLSHGVRVNDPRRVLRHAPSAGNRHAIDTYLSVMNVEGVEPGIYRYHPLAHKLVRIEKTAQAPLREQSYHAILDQSMAYDAACLFIWVAVPYRMEWRYGYASSKVIALDAGHICQNLYLACEAIDAGACAIAAYDQKRSDQLVKRDGIDEFVIYLCSVGKNPLK